MLTEETTGMARGIESFERSAGSADAMDCVNDSNAYVAGGVGGGLLSGAVEGSGVLRGTEYPTVREVGSSWLSLPEAMVNSGVTIVAG